MLTIKYQTVFKKDYKRIKKRGYDVRPLEKVDDSQRRMSKLLRRRNSLWQSQYKDEVSDCRTCSNGFFACYILSVADCGKDSRITSIKEVQSPAGLLIFDNRAGNFCQFLLAAAVVIRQSPLVICMESFEEKSALFRILLEPIVKTPFSKTLLTSFPTA